MEHKIIKLLKENNIKGIDLLSEKYSKNIYYVVRSILKDKYSKEDIEECISDVCIDIYRNINLFDKEKLNFNQFVILRSKYIALEYKSRIHTEDYINKEDNSNTFTIDDIKIEELINNQDNKEVLNIIKSFIEPDRTYFYLRYFRGYDEVSIAQRYNKCTSDIQNRLYRCRFKIKNILERGAKVNGK